VPGTEFGELQRAIWNREFQRLRDGDRFFYANDPALQYIVFPDGQQVTQLWNGVVAQDGARVPVTNATWNGTLNPGQTLGGVGFNATWSGVNNRPTAFYLNTTACAIG
jgi:hypothetical protein